MNRRGREAPDKQHRLSASILYPVNTILTAHCPHESSSVLALAIADWTTESRVAGWSVNWTIVSPFDYDAVILDLAELSGKCCPCLFPVSNCGSGISAHLWQTPKCWPSRKMPNSQIVQKALYQIADSTCDVCCAYPCSQMPIYTANW